MTALPDCSTWNTSDDYDETSYSTDSPIRRIMQELDIPGGVITTRCVSSVIRPGRATHDPLQFVKIQSTELSKKAVEQIRLAEEVKITKEKIKEVEEEWQNNLLNWKSKRRQSRTSDNSTSEDGLNDSCNNNNNNNNNNNGSGRKIRTFSEILNEKAKSGGRICYNLLDYVKNFDDDDNSNDISSSSSKSTKLTVSNLNKSNHECDQQADNNNGPTDNNNQLRKTKSSIEIGQNGTNGQQPTSNADELINDHDGRRSECKQVEDTDGQSGFEIQKQMELAQKRRQLTDKLHQLEIENRENQEQQKREHRLSTETENNRKNLIERNGALKSISSITVHPTTESRSNLSNNKVCHSKSNGRLLSSSSSSSTSSSSSSLNSKNDASNRNGILRNSKNDADDDEHDGGDFVNQRNGQSGSSIYDQYSNQVVDEKYKQEPIFKSFRSKLSTFESMANGSSSAQVASSISPSALQTRTSKVSNHKQPSDKLNSNNNSDSQKTKIVANKRNENQLEANLHHEPKSQQTSHHRSQLEIGNTKSDSLPPENERNSAQCKVSELPKLTAKCEKQLTNQREGGGKCQEKTPEKIHLNNSISDTNNFDEENSLKPVGKTTINTTTTTTNSTSVHSGHRPLMPKVKPTVPIRPYLQREYPLIEEDFHSHRGVFKTMSNSSEVSSDSGIIEIPSGRRGSNPSNNSSRITSCTIRQGPRPYQNPRLVQKNSCPLSIGSHDPSSCDQKIQKQKQKHEISGSRCEQIEQSSSVQTHNSSSSLACRQFQPISKSLSTPNMSSQMYPLISDWICQKAEIESRPAQTPSPGTPTSQSPSSTRPIISSEIFGPSSGSAYLAGKRANSEIQLIPKASKNEDDQNRKRTLSVSGKKRCSNCGDELARGSAAMVIEALSLYYHINCFRCSICHVEIGSGHSGTDVRVRNRRLHCQKCHSNL